jgi:hypothetical protein
VGERIAIAGFVLPFAVLFLKFLLDQDFRAWLGIGLFVAAIGGVLWFAGRHAHPDERA